MACGHDDTTINIVLVLLLFFTLGIKDPEGFGKNRRKLLEWPLLRAVLKHKGIV